MTIQMHHKDQDEKIKEKRDHRKCKGQNQRYVKQKG
jgi:hypothetical protein